MKSLIQKYHLTYTMHALLKLLKRVLLIGIITIFEC